MSYEIVLSPLAEETFLGLSAHLQQFVELHLNKLAESPVTLSRPSVTPPLSIRIPNVRVHGGHRRPSSRFRRVVQIRRQRNDPGRRRLGPSGNETRRWVTRLIATVPTPPVPSTENPTAGAAADHHLSDLVPVAVGFLHLDRDGHADEQALGELVGPLDDISIEKCVYVLIQFRQLVEGLLARLVGPTVPTDGPPRSEPRATWNLEREGRIHE